MISNFACALISSNEEGARYERFFVTVERFFVTHVDVHVTVGFELGSGFFS